MKLEMSSVLREDYYCILLDEDEDEDDMLYDVCTNDSKKHWRNGIVPYVLNKNIKGKLKNSVRKGMDKISDVCAVEFVEINKPSNNMNYIEIIKGGKFASFVGMKGGKQGLLVAKGWPHPIGHVMHELLHALGFHHEHSRPDRDDNVIVINNNKNKNYDKLKESEVICFGSYDYESIMHYPLGNITLKKVKVKIGQREKLSNGDVYALNKLYPREKLLRSRREALVRGNEELKRVENRSPVDNDRKEELKKEIRILERILERYDDKFMNLPQTSGPRM